MGEQTRSSRPWRNAPVPTPRVEGACVPGSAEAEAAADALLCSARECGMRVVWSLRRAAPGSGPAGAGLRRAADEIALSCAYYTEAQLRRRYRAEARLVVPVPVEEVGDAEAAAHGVDWLSGLVQDGLQRLAESIGLTPRQAEVWIENVRGETQEELAASLGISRSALRVHLRRAQQRADESWLAAYGRALHATAYRGRRRGVKS